MIRSEGLVSGLRTHLVRIILASCLKLRTGHRGGVCTCRRCEWVRGQLILCSPQHKIALLSKLSVQVSVANTFKWTRSHIHVPHYHNITMSWAYYVSFDFLYASTINVFNFTALISATLLLLDPVVFTIHTGYDYYQARQALKAETEKSGGATRAQPQRKHGAKNPKTVWWKWYVISATVHLFDAWFFRSIIPFFERARSQKDLPPNDFQDLADIVRLLWGIIRALSLFVIALEIWEKRLVLNQVLGMHWKNPKWGFATSYFLAPMIIAVSGIPVVIYLVVLALWNSTGFFWGVIKEAFTPDWRSGQDVFV